MENQQKKLSATTIISLVVILVVVAGIYFYAKHKVPVSQPVNTSSSQVSSKPVDSSNSGTSNTNSSTKTATSTKPVSKPVVSNIVYKAATGFSQNPYLSWKTDRAVKTKVFYDTAAIILVSAPVPTSASATFSGANNGLYVLDPAFTTTHAFEFPNLTPGTLYHYVIQSIDRAGSMSLTTGTFTTGR